MIKQFNYRDIDRKYPDLFKGSFGFDFDTSCPPETVYLCFDGDTYIGFVAGMKHAENIFYIQRAGTPEPGEGKKRRFYFRVWHEVLRCLADEGFDFATCRILNTNRRALLVVLRSGFIVEGCKIGPSGLHVLVYRPLKEKDKWLIS